MGLLRVGVISTQNGLLSGALVKYLQERGEILAERVKDAKKNGVVDGFFYSSVSGEYLAAALDSL